MQDLLQTHIDTYEMTAEDYMWAQNVMDIYDSINLNNYSSTRSSIDENTVKLRTGNLIESTLNISEGVVLAEVSCLRLGESAKVEAQQHFSRYQDSAQHFIWNFNMTVSHNKAVARTVGNNHEWGISMIEPMLSAYGEFFRINYNKGIPADKSAELALAETLVYIPVFKSHMVPKMQASYQVFDQFFSDESKMDFWNNCYGRAYPEKGYTSAVSAFRYSAFTKKELVLDGSSTGNMAANLTSQQKQNIWAWDWYSY